MSNKKYLEMFNTPYFLKTDGESLTDAKKEIDWARKTLKKEDWIVWYLRLYKYEKLSKHLETPSQSRHIRQLLQDTDLTKDKKFFDKMKKFGCTNENYSVFNIKNELQHLIDMNLPKINSMVFGWKEPKRLFDQAEDYQLSWQAENEGKTTEEYGHKLIEFDDGSAWFDLQVSGCEQEAELMGHCGNGSHNPNSPQTVLSYRKPILDNTGDEPETRWIPYLTFILNKETGELGEMKGRANSKPAERYHDSIIQLLKDDKRITKVVGGGYKAENNFSLSDLDKDKYNDLMDSKPSLFSLYQVWKKHGDVEMIGDYDFSDAIDTELCNKGIIEHKGEKHYILHDGLDLEDLASQFNLSDLESNRQAIEEGHFEQWEPDSDWSTYLDDKVENKLGEWMKENPVLAKKMILKLESEFSEKIDEEDIDINTAEGIVELAKNEDTFVNTAFHSAAMSGNEMGAMNNLTENYSSLMKDFFKSEHITLIRHEDNYDKYSVGFTKKQFFDFVEEYQEEFEDLVIDCQMSEFESLEDLINEQELIEANDLDVPYNGFEGFCDESFDYRIKECLSDQVNEHCKGAQYEILHQIKCEGLPKSILSKVSKENEMNI